MKRSEIQVGRTYTRDFARGDVGRRTVIGDADSRSPRQRDRDEMTVRVLVGPRAGSEYTFTRAATARWVQREETTGPVEPLSPRSSSSPYP